MTTLNTELLNNPEVREIGMLYAAHMGLSADYVCPRTWDEFVAKQSRKPAYTTCKHDGAQQVFEGEYVCFVQHLDVNKFHFSYTKAYNGIAERHTGDFGFKTRESAENFMCENYMFTVKEVIEIVGVWYQSSVDKTKVAFRSILFNEAKKRLRI